MASARASSFTNQPEFSRNLSSRGAYLNQALVLLHCLTVKPVRIHNLKRANSEQWPHRRRRREAEVSTSA